MTDLNKGGDSPIQFKGKTPPQFFQALKDLKQEKKDSDVTVGKDPYADLKEAEATTDAPAEAPAAPPVAPAKKPQQYVPKAPHQTKARVTGSPQLEDLIADLVERGVAMTKLRSHLKAFFMMALMDRLMASCILGP